VKLRARHFRSGITKTFVVSGATAADDLVFGPGFLDLQCNGFAGIDFNHPATTAEQVATAIRAMRRHGCTQILPTIITHSPDRMEHLLRTLVAARILDPGVRRAVPGFHLEGPFFSPEDGARGAHPREHIRPVERALWRRLQRAAEGGIRLVTLAPEVLGALPFIRQLRAEGVCVALGHTLATRGQIAAAVEAGAQLATHLGNGCPQQLHRHDNPIFAQLADDRLAASLIADGVHLPSDVLRTFFRAKGAARTILVTDAMAAAGAPPGRYTLGDHTLAVGRDRIVRQPGQPNFAGSALAMNDAVARFMHAAGATLAQAWSAASTIPRKLLRIAPTRDIVIASPSGKTLEVVGILPGGNPPV
jgi:N-acetylglucosamine-6-phosphate deacetylase